MTGRTCHCQVSYSNASKTELLGVEAALIAAHGAVSEAVARAMVQGALTHSAAQVAVALTGVAGPTGGSFEKPVGTVWLAWCTPSGVDASSTVQAIEPRYAEPKCVIRYGV